jgi:hypothetical protein
LLIFAASIRALCFAVLCLSSLLLLRENYFSQMETEVTSLRSVFTKVITGPVMKLLSVGGESSSCTSAHSGKSLESVGLGDGMRFANSIESCAID